MKDEAIQLLDDVAALKDLLLKAKQNLAASQKIIAERDEKLEIVTSK